MFRLFERNDMMRGFKVRDLDLYWHSREKRIETYTVVPKSLDRRSRHRTFIVDPQIHVDSPR